MDAPPFMFQKSEEVHVDDSMLCVQSVEFEAKMCGMGSRSATTHTLVFPWRVTERDAVRFVEQLIADKIRSGHMQPKFRSALVGIRRDDPETPSKVRLDMISKYR